jgi:extracellular factor (EF) 3-hydroxypalmitic acid methyl ester biosynthesis protein
MTTSLLYEGPEESHYQEINRFFAQQYGNNKEAFLNFFSEIRPLVPAFQSPRTITGFSYLQPHGYAGDFELIDRLYTHYISTHPEESKWDRFAQAQPAAKAVRNRKDYFIRLLNSGKYHHVLNLASGPGRDLKEFFDQAPHATLQVDCVEIDPNAIRYAEGLIHRKKQVRFLRQNVLRFVPNEPYDLIWSAGLFDYFSDTLFVRILHRLLTAAKPGAEIVVGNFCSSNPNRAFMEVAMNWQLHHRSQEALTGLALEAGAALQNITVEREPEGVNLFLHLLVKESF